MFFRNRRIPSLLLAVAVLVLLSACSGRGVSPATAAKSADEIGQAWKSLANISDEPLKSPLKFGDDSFRSSRSESVQTYIKDVPTTAELGQMSPELKTSIETLFTKLKQEQVFIRETTDLLTDVSLRQRSAAGEIEAIVSRSGTTLKAEAKEYVKKTGEEILREVGCELAWTHLTEPERHLANTQVTDNGAVYTYGDRVAVAPESTLDKIKAAFISAISGAGKTAYMKAYVDPEVVDWAMYGKGIYEKAALMTGDGSKTLVHPDGTITYGFMYYIKICMRPPV